MDVFGSFIIDCILVICHRQSPGGNEGSDKKQNASRPSKHGSTPAPISQSRKTQGKITDFITKTSGTGNRPSISASPSRNSRIATRGSPRSPTASRSPQPTGKENANKQKSRMEARQTRTSFSGKVKDSLMTRSTRKREASIEKSSPVAKRTKAEEPRLKRSSPKKSRSAKSPSPPPKATKSMPAIPSPISPTDKSPLKLVPVKSAGIIRLVKVPWHVRRAAALMNGTSDGEESTPDSRKSISPSTAVTTKTRAAALAKAIQEQGDTELNIGSSLYNYRSNVREERGKDEQSAVTSRSTATLL
ncbi:hypothetical protein LSH36_155g04018 [Paralvinella palmiformis]|uniref:Uncharacterized protein n=1 Tax=Paralvinella palmiformis TaxID=53620 RepID=A0AAD9JVY2_9ANNE|nr:hypothetical protein LSH36_155g04018 [Paralvinella palmiformis]